MNKKILIIIFLIIISFSIGFLTNNLIFTGQTIQPLQKDNQQNTLTKAICNENNDCIDILITCINKTPVNLELVSNLTKLPENWTDTRENKGLCE